jgi:hypothetical protein
MEKMKDICYFGVVVGVLVLAIIILKIYTGIDFWSLGYLLAPWVTVTGIVLGLYGAFIALKTYRSNNSLRKWELIKEIFDAFMKYDLYRFYERIKDEEEIDYEKNTKDKQLLNKALTLFDALSYFHEQGLLDDKSWEYFACEIYTFSLNKSVPEYMLKIKELYKSKGFPNDIIPFTGFPALVKKLLSLDDFKLKRNPQLEQIEMWMKKLDN